MSTIRQVNGCNVLGDNVFIPLYDPFTGKHSIVLSFDYRTQFTIIDKHTVFLPDSTGVLIIYWDGVKRYINNTWYDDIYPTV